MERQPNWQDLKFVLTKEFEFEDFSEALDFVNRVGQEAEREDHHPDILIHNYNKVRITLSTHDVNRVTVKDRNLARRIDVIAGLAVHWRDIRL